MKKYYRVFLNQLHRKSEYRFNLFLNQLRSMVVFLILYFVWVSAASGKTFAGYTKTELVTYVFGATLLSALILSNQSKHIVNEINEGNISSILVKPINYFWYSFFDELAGRTIMFVLSLIELLVLYLFLRFDIIFQTSPQALGVFTLSFVLALFLYYLMSFCVSLCAFWSREASGPRFLFDWTIQFAAGQFFPLSILAKIYFYTLSFLPFAFTLYVPLQIYIGKISAAHSMVFLIGQAIWLIAFSILAKILWTKGLKRYSGEGI